MKYGDFGVAAFPYYTPVHSFTIQSHCICEDHILMMRDGERKDSQFPLSLSTMTPPRPPSLRKSSMHASDAAFIDSPLNFTRRAIVEHVANRMKYYGHGLGREHGTWK